jgi:hypothetical protein
LAQLSVALAQSVLLFNTSRLSFEANTVPISGFAPSFSIKFRRQIHSDFLATSALKGREYRLMGPARLARLQRIGPNSIVACSKGIVGGLAGTKKAPHSPG